MVKFKKFLIAYYILWVLATGGVVFAQNDSEVNLKDSSNRCKNGSFEILNPAGDNFPVGWGHGKFVVIDKDAHSGAVAIRMSAVGGFSPILNSDVIAVRKGKVEFWYKAVGSDTAGDNLRMYVIGVASETEVKRVSFKVTGEHVGDSQWHKGMVEFDFTDDSRIDGILLAPRINELCDGKNGEWLIDDFECMAETLGAQPQIAALYMPEPIIQIGKPAELVLHLRNQGDIPTEHSRLILEVPAGIEIKNGSANVDVEPILQNGSHRFNWYLTGDREGQINISIKWIVEGKELIQSRSTVCVNKIELRNLCTDAAGCWRFMPKPISLQQDNMNVFKALETKKSSELPDSFIGVTAHLPRSKDLESIFEPAYLIDGNYETNWSSWAHASDTPGAVEWIQLDLKKTEYIREIRLVPYYKSEGFPVDFTIKLRDNVSGKWETAYKVHNLKISQTCGEGNKEPYIIKLSSPVKTDVIRIEVERFRVVSGFFCDCGITHYFRISEVEAISTQNKNVAMDAKVTVSSTFCSWYNKKEVISETYKELYNLGVKWNRVGQWGDWTCWAAVEQKKGRYYIDPVMDEAITESVKNGVSILYTLCYGNRLYEETPWLMNPGPVWREGHPFTGAGGPTTSESIQGFVNYARFVAKHFKGRVKYYEIWNEENSWAWYGSPPLPKAFGTLLRETAKALKEIDPDIRVSVGGTAANAPNFISDSLQEGAGKYLDAIAFHPYTSPYPEIGMGALDVIDGVQVSKTTEELGFHTFKEMIACLQKTFARYNPNFEFWANEWNAIPKREDAIIGSGSEIREAKVIARWYTMATITKVRAIWWTLANQNSVMDWALLRMKDNSKKPVFYVTANMATILSGAEPTPLIKTYVTGDVPELYCEPLRGRDGEFLVAVWSAIAPDNDDYTGKRVSLKVEFTHPATTETVEAVDTLHGLVQKLSFKTEGDSAVIDKLLVTDYPIIVRIK